MCQLFISKDFETSLLTLLGVSLVLWRRKADNAHSNPLFYGPRPQNSQHLHFQFPITSLLKILLEVVAIGRKNAGKDPDTPPLPIAMASQTITFFVPFCIVMPTHGEGEGREFCLGGRGELEGWNDDDVGVTMKWSALYILFTKEFLRDRGEHTLLFCFAFTFRTLLCSLRTLLVGGEPPPPPVVDYLTICCRRRLGRTTNHFV